MHGRIKQICRSALSAVLAIGIAVPFAIDNVQASAGTADAGSARLLQSELLLKESSVGGSLYGKPDWHTGRYRSMLLKLNGKEKTVAWQPLIDRVSSFGADLDGDGSKEWILELTMDAGTGYAKGEARILRSDLSEIPIENPKKAAAAALRSSMSRSDGKVTYTVNVSGKKRILTYDEKDANWWFEGATAGNIVHYAMEHGRLTARLSTQVSPGLLIGTTKVYYEYQDGRLKTSEVAFTTNF